MTITDTGTPIPGEDESHGSDLNSAIRDYVRTYVLWHGRAKAAETFGVSRHTLWRCLERGRLGKSLPRAVIKAVGDDPVAIEAAAWAMTASRIRRRAAANPQPLAETLEDTLRLLCAAPLATAEELSVFGRIPATTLRRSLARLAGLGLVDSVSHHLDALGSNPRRRHCPTERSIEAAARVEHGTERFLSEYPVSREWFRILTERLDALAVLYHLAAVIARADPQGQLARVDHYRQGPYDLLMTLSGGRSLGIVCQRPVLPSANLRYRLSTLEQLRYFQRPTATLVLTHSHQATRRAFRTLGDPSEHRSTFVATEGELLAGDAQAPVWQQCGAGNNSFLPEAINADVSLDNILGWLGRRAKNAAAYRPRPDPDELYPTGLRAMMPKPPEQVKSSLAVRLTRAEKQALDLLAAWPLCNMDQLAGLMGGVTRRRANQVLRSLAEHGLVRADGPLHVLTDEGLTYLARRDRAAVGQTLDRWTAEPSRHNLHIYAGTALRAMASQPEHHAALTTLAASLHRRMRPLPGLRRPGPAAHLPLRRGVLVRQQQLCRPPRRFLLPGSAGGIPSLLPGVRAPGHHAPAGAGQAGELPPLFPERLRPAGPRRGAAPGAVRLRDRGRRGGLPGRRRRRGARPLRQLQSGDHRPAGHPG